MASIAAEASTTERFLEVLKSFDTAILLTHAPNGDLHGRPMALADIDSDGVLWFVTRVDSPKIDEIRTDPRAIVTCQDKNQFATIEGHCEVARDAQKINDIWKESYKVWFDGKGDPKLVLLRFVPDHGEYWDNSGSKGIRYAFKAVAAYVQGKKLGPGANDDPEAHGKVEL
jgi:general stress protein 26